MKEKLNSEMQPSFFTFAVYYDLQGKYQELWLLHRKLNILIEHLESVLLHFISIYCEFYIHTNKAPE